MAKKKANRAKLAIPYARRAVEDEYVQEQIRSTVTRLSDALARISRQKADATEDKKLYTSLRSAALSIRKAVGAIEEPPPKAKRRGRKALLLGAALAGVLVIAKRRTSGDSEPAPQPRSTANNGDQRSSSDSTPRQTPAETAA
jgi:ferric-dicitrate binding protein FerR (iron transport regulator)